MIEFRLHILKMIIGSKFLAKMKMTVNLSFKLLWHPWVISIYQYTSNHLSTIFSESSRFLCIQCKVIF